MTTHSPAAADAAVRDSLLSSLDSALEQLAELPPLDEARFLATHAIFEGLSGQRQRIIDELCARLDPPTPVDRPLRVLGVGCGAGDVDEAVARSLVAEVEELVYVGVDPSRAECEAMEQRFAEADIPGVRLEVEIATFEDFVPAQSFDVVHFVHSLYYMSDPAAALVRARQILGPGGQLIVVQAPREELNELAVRFYDKCYERPTLFADDFAKILERWDWSFDRTRLDARIDVTALVEGDSEVGAALRDFVVQVDGRRLPPSVQGLIERYLCSIAFEHHGRSFIAHPVDAFFISE